MSSETYLEFLGQKPCYVEPHGTQPGTGGVQKNITASVKSGHTTLMLVTPGDLAAA